MPNSSFAKTLPFRFGFETTTKIGAGITSAYTQEQHNYEVETSERYWTNTAGYRHKRKLGQRLPMNILIEKYASQTPVNVSGSGGTRSGSDYVLREGNRIISSGGFIDPPGLPELNDELILKALKKAKEHSFNAPIFFAEAGKTTDMIMSRLADLRGLARSLRKGDVSGFLTKSKAFHSRTSRSRRIPGLPDRHPIGGYPPDWKVREVEHRFNTQFGRDAQVACGNMWLEWKYGWQSVMMDVQGLAETIEEVRSKDANLDGVIKTSVTRRSFTVSPHTLEVSPQTTGIREDTITLKGTLTCRFQMNNPDLLLPAKVGLTNPLSVAWELIPFSFVVDWFLPIGNFIDALDVHFLYTFYDKILVNKTIHYRKIIANQSDLFNYSASGVGGKLMKFKKRDSTNMGLSFGAIQWKNGFANPERIFTSLALLGQTLAGFSHPVHGLPSSKSRRSGAVRPPDDWSRE